MIAYDVFPLQRLSLYWVLHHLFDLMLSNILEHQLLSQSQPNNLPLSTFVVIGAENALQDPTNCSVSDHILRKVLRAEGQPRR
jgi:hypothetical protein